MRNPLLIVFFDIFFSTFFFKAEPSHPCHPTPCGTNAICQERSGAGACSCIPEYYGDPYVECRPECIMNSDCPSNRACINNKCVDPCPGTCGVNAECRIVNHSPLCTCYHGYIGNPLSACSLPPSKMSLSPLIKHREKAKRHFLSVYFQIFFF